MINSRRLLGAWAIGLVIVLIPLTETALGHDQPAQWRDGHQIGFCNYTTNPYVRSWQSILWAEGYFQATSAVDGIFGNQSDTATKQYQGQHSLQSDGCVGYATWNNAQNGRHFNSQLNTYFDHMTLISSSCCPQVWTWHYRRSNDNRRIKYRRVDINCWVLDNLLNEGNNNQVFFDQPINHDGHNHCHI